MSGKDMIPQWEVDRMVRDAEERVRASMKRKIREHGECRICLKIPKDGVRLQQCQNGHLACQKCMDSLPNPQCGSCRAPLANKIREPIQLCRELFIIDGNIHNNVNFSQ